MSGIIFRFYGLQRHFATFGKTLFPFHPESSFDLQHHHWFKRAYFCFICQKRFCDKQWAKSDKLPSKWTCMKNLKFLALQVLQKCCLFLVSWGFFGHSSTFFSLVLLEPQKRWGIFCGRSFTDNITIFCRKKTGSEQEEKPFLKAFKIALEVTMLKSQGRTCKMSMKFCYLWNSLSESN